jgi:uncharacterized delta-60 repeat protein
VLSQADDPSPGFIQTTGTVTAPAFAVQSDGKIVVATRNDVRHRGVDKGGLSRLTTSGRIDTTYNTGMPNADGFYPELVLIDGDGKAVVFGSYLMTWKGTTLNGFARFNTDGTLDTGFNTGANPGITSGSSGFKVTCAAIQSDGKIVIGGIFTDIRGVTQNGIARLNTDGSLDTGFNTGVNPGVSGVGTAVYAIAIQSDGKILIGGPFTSARGTTQNYIARLNTNGSLDTGFNTGGTVGTDNTVTSIFIQPTTGKIVIAGGFTTVRGTKDQYYYSRLNTDGTLDASYNQLPVQYPFSSLNAGQCAMLDGELWMTYGAPVFKGQWHGGYDIVHLNVDGSLNTDWRSDLDVSAITTAVSKGVLPLSDGKLLVNGAFKSFAGVYSNGFVRLNTDGTVDTTFNPSYQIGTVETALPLKTPRLGIATETDSAPSYKGPVIVSNTSFRHSSRYLYSMTVTMPTDIQQGDLAILNVAREWAGQTATMTITGTDWTAVSSGAIIGSAFVSGAWYSVLDGTEGGTNYTIEWAGDTFAWMSIATITIVRGASSLSTFDGTPNHSNAVATTVNFPPVTINAPHELVVVGMMLRNGADEWDEPYVDAPSAVPWHLQNRYTTAVGWVAGQHAINVFSYESSAATTIDLAASTYFNVNQASRSLFVVRGKGITEILGYASETDEAMPLVSAGQVVTCAYPVETDAATALAAKAKTKTLGFAEESSAYPTIPTDTFETALGGWANGGLLTVTRSTDEANSGTYSLKAVGASVAGSADLYMSYNNPTPRAGASLFVEVSLWAKSTVGTVWLFSDYETATLLTGTWQQVAYRALCDGWGDVFFDVYPVDQPNWNGILNVGDTFYIDDVTYTLHAARSTKTKTLGYATETDTTQAITRAKAKTLDYASEADTAQAITRYRVRPLTSSVETDTAQAVTRVNFKTLGYASETGIGTALALRSKSKTLGYSAETDASLTLSRELKAKALTIAAEVDAALQITLVTTIGCGYATETDTAQAVTCLNTYTLVHAAETDTAQPLGMMKILLLGYTSETDAAEAVMKSKSKTLGYGGESDTAYPVTVITPVIVTVELWESGTLITSLGSHNVETIGTLLEFDITSYIGSLVDPTGDGIELRVTSSKSVEINAAEWESWHAVTANVTILGRADETDAAQAITPAKAIALTQAQETDAAQPLTQVQTFLVQYATETDAAQAAVRSKARTLAEAAETDAGTSLALRSKTLTLTYAAESNTAYALAKTKTRTLTSITESDTAQAVVKVKVRALTYADEADTTQALARSKTLLLGYSTENDSAQQATWLRTITLTYPVESDAPLLITSKAKTRTLAYPSEIDEGIAITQGQTFPVTFSAESNAAQQVSKVKAKALTVAAEVDAALQVTLVTVIPCGYASEVDAALAVTRLRTYTLTHPTEGDTAQPLTQVQTFLVTYPVEVDAAQALSKAKTRTLGYATETDEAFPVIVSLSTALGIAQETDTAQQPSRLKTRTLITSVESDDAQALTQVQTFPVAYPTETDESHLVTRVKTRTVGPADEADAAIQITIGSVFPVTYPTETDTAQAVTATKTRILGSSTETDTTQALSRSKTQTLGQAAEMNAASPVTGLHVTALTYATEADTAQALTRVKARFLTFGAETDAAQAVSLAETRTVGYATEADAAQAATKAKIRTLTYPAETDTPQPVTVLSTFPLTHPTEADTGQPLSRSKTRILGLGYETDEPLAVTIGSVVALLYPGESDTAQPVSKTKTRTLIPAVEYDTALPATGVRPVPVGYPAETDQTFPIALRVKTRPLGQAWETDTAQQLTISDALNLSSADEADSAQPVTAAKTGVLGYPVELDTAQPVTQGQIFPLTPAQEADAALALTLAKTRTLTAAQETDTAAAVQRLKSLPLLSPSELDEAIPVTAGQTFPVTYPVEADTAQTLTRVRVRTLSSALETDSAQALAGSVVLTSGVETDETFPLTLAKVVILGYPIEHDQVFNGRAIGPASETNAALTVTAVKTRESWGILWL